LRPHRYSVRGGVDLDVEQVGKAWMRIDAAIGQLDVNGHVRGLFGRFSEALIVGNAAIADLTLLKQGATMIITGKGFGETNFIALDAAGNPLAQSLIRVVGGRNALLVQRGMGRESYACAPQCLPTAKLGDDAKYFVEVAGQVKDHNAQATGLQ
jgi:Pilus formation protein N terminal region